MTTPESEDTARLPRCPFCGEEVEIYVEEDVRGSFVQDCEVCCNPWLVRVRRAADGIGQRVTRRRLGMKGDGISGGGHAPPHCALVQ